MNCARRQMCWQGDFIGNMCLSGEQKGKQTWKDCSPPGDESSCSATWPMVSNFLVMGLVLGCLWPVMLMQGPTWVACASLSQDGFQWEGFWEVGRTYGLVSPVSFWPFLNSPTWWWWLVTSMFLTRISYHKITHANVYCSVRADSFSQRFPNTWIRD